jgi:hypothetical protein
MAWTDIDDSFLEPGKPIRSADLIALRDNPIAITEGSPGAPAIASASLADYPWGAEDFQTGNDERDWVLGRNAGAALGAVGTYATLRNKTASVISEGSTSLGSNLQYSNTGGTIFGGSPAGTWRVMGLMGVAANPASDSQSTCLRIS